jgi:hypothetical protein
MPMIFSSHLAWQRVSRRKHCSAHGGQLSLGKTCCQKLTAFLLNLLLATQDTATAP